MKCYSVPPLPILAMVALDIFNNFSLCPYTFFLLSSLITIAMQFHSYSLHRQHRLPHLLPNNGRSGLARSPLPSSDSLLRLRTSEFSRISKLSQFGAHSVYSLRAFDEDSFGGGPLLDDWGEGELPTGYYYSSSDEDNESEILLTSLSDVDLPSYSAQNNDALTVTAHRFAMLGRGLRKHRSKRGTLISLGLIIFQMLLLLYIDWCAWRIVRLPLEPFFLTRPFLISGVLVCGAGYVCIPLFRALKIYQVIRKVGPIRQSFKRATPTMGGLFFIPIGVAVARFIAGSSTVEVSGAVVATLAFAVIGLLDDISSIIKNHNYGLPALSKIILEGAVGACFSYWLENTSISSPYGMKSIIPLPIGLLCLGQCYQYLTSFCFISMGNGLHLTDGLDGLAGGTAALAFIGMSIAVLPICPGLAAFGASMAGSCLGFLVHNRYKASIFMGDTGSLALGGGLAAMAACTGMFFPLFITSGIFVVETSSVILQVLYFKITNRLKGRRRRLFHLAPFHHHLELIGFKEPTIVAGAYVISSVLALFAGYVALISV